MFYWVVNAPLIFKLLRRKFSRSLFHDKTNSKLNDSPRGTCLLCNIDMSHHLFTCLRGADQEIFKRWGEGGDALCRLPQKILGFRWSKKAEVTLETISLGQNISISILKFSPFLLIKSCQFFKSPHTAVNEKRKTEKC